jgi:hypothetical protein
MLEHCLLQLFLFILSPNSEILGRKDADYDSSFWDDHDENCHGRFEDLVDESEFQEGFIWDCCDKLGDHEGCKSTKHKSAINHVVAVVEVPSRKRGVEDNNVDNERDNSKRRLW